MTAETGSPRAVRLGALVLFVLLPLTAALFTVLNVVRLGESEELIVRQEQLLAQLDARLARVGGDGRGLGDTSPLYLPATSAPLAGAALQQRLVAAVETVGGRVIETQSVEENQPDAEDDVRLRITLDVDNEGLRALMHDLETGLPLMTLETVAVRQLPSQGDDPGDNPILRVDLGVRGYWRAAT
ncbi:MAG TPA: type II secretion system protein GspM [Methylomirabilota bacterium]|nr:type II secretion system protein GspM [Methylomirabilota bacterium]